MDTQQEPTVRAVFGSYASVVSIVGDCWLAPKGKEQFYKLKTCKFIKAGAAANSLVRVCENDRCVHPEHLIRAHSPAGRMLYIKEHSYQDGDCRIWTGMRSPQGTPIMPLKRPGNKTHTNERVPRFVYEQEHGGASASGSLVETSCGKVECVSHKHIVCKVPPTDGRCPEGHAIKKPYRTFCATCARPKADTHCDRCQTRFTPREAPVFTEVGCWVCRRNDATEFIRKRNAEMKV